MTRQAEKVVSESQKLSDKVRVLTAERDDLRQQLKQRKADIQALYEVMAIIGHELRNPLMPILNGLELIRRKRAKKSEIYELAEMVLRHARHLSSLIEEILVVSRYTSGKVQFVPRRIDLHQLIRFDTIESAAPGYRGKGITFDVDTGDDPVWVMGDQVKLLQIIHNLINNAVKFSSRKGIIQIRLGVLDKQAVLIIADMGRGIAPELLESIFERWVQEERGRTASSTSFGLGLSIVKEAAELHGGTVTAESDGHGKGATFTVRLPLATDEEPEVIQETEEGKSVTPLKILIVDDNQDAAITMKDLLELFGHKSWITFSGKDALDMARASVPDIILCDLGLPVMDGYEILRQLRETPLLRETPVIAMTGYGDDDTRKRTREAGFYQHLVKPVDLDELQRVLASLERTTS